MVISRSTRRLSPSSAMQNSSSAQSAASSLPTTFSGIPLHSSSLKSLSFNKRLQQHRSYLVSLIPILFQLPYTQRKRMRCQIPHPYVRNYQKSTITYHLTQVLLPSALIPSYPSLPSFQPPCRRTKRKSSHISIPLALYQILHLMPAQWPTAKIMILIHQLFPYPIWLAIPAVYLDYSYLSQFGQFTLDAFPHSLLLTVTTFLNSRTRALFCLRQLDYPFPVQSQKNYTATRIFQSPIRTPPLQGFAYLPGLLCPGLFQVFCYFISFFIYIFRRFFFPAYLHAG